MGKEGLPKPATKTAAYSSVELREGRRISVEKRVCVKQIESNIEKRLPFQDSPARGTENTIRERDLTGSGSGMRKRSRRQERNMPQPEPSKSDQGLQRNFGKGGATVGKTAKHQSSKTRRMEEIGGEPD